MPWGLSIINVWQYCLLTQKKHPKGEFLVSAARGFCGATDDASCEDWGYLTISLSRWSMIDIILLSSLCCLVQESEIKAHNVCGRQDNEGQFSQKVGRMAARK